MQEHQVYVGTLGSLDAKPVMKSRLPAVYVPGYLLFLRDQTLMAQPINDRTFQLSGAPTPIAEHVAVNSTTSRPVFSASNDLKIVYQIGSEQGGWQLLWLTRDGKQIGTAGDIAAYADPAVSPDGTRVAVGIFTGQGSSDIWIFDLRRAAKTRLTFGTAILRFPVWTPDGKTIFYGSNVKGAYHIYAKAADGTGPEQVILEDDAFDYPWDISPDQKYLVYMRPSADGKGGTEMWALSLSGDRKPFAIVSSLFTTSAAAISPDGRWMAYASIESGRFEVYVTAFPSGGAKWEVSVNGGSLPKWRRDGKELFFLDPADNLMAVDVNTSRNTIQTGTPHPLFRPVGLQSQLGPYAVTADGKRFLINGGNVKEENQPFVLVQNWTAQLKK